MRNVEFAKTIEDYRLKLSYITDSLNRTDISIE